MRLLPLLAAIALLSPVALPQEKKEAKANEEVVKAVRALLSAKRLEEQDKLKEELLKRQDLDWTSFRKGIEEGPYYQKPLVTAFGKRHSRKHFDLVFSGEDGTPRGFTMWVPKQYDAKTPLPLIVYLHHGSTVEHINAGATRADVAVTKFKKMCDEHGLFLVAPYTSKGAEWWTPQGKRLVEWTLLQIRRLYNIDDDRIGLLGALDGADAVWYLGQEMPGTWSVLMPMTGDPYEITAIVRPLFLGTLDRMDVLMGVPGKTRSTVGEKDENRFLADLKPLFGQRMRITAAVWPRSQGDFQYLEKIDDSLAAFVKSHKRHGYAKEVDVETEAEYPLRSLWLRNDGYFAEGPAAHGFKSTHLKWTPPKYGEAERKLGINVDPRPNWAVGIVITQTPGAAKHAQIVPGDVLLEAEGKPIKNANDLKAVLKEKDFGDEVRVLLAREVTESGLKRHERVEARYRRYRQRIAELRAAGKPIPRNLWAELEDVQDTGKESEGGDEEDEGDGFEVSEDDGFEVSDDQPKKRAKAEKTHIKIIERWVKLQRPARPLVRRDFGAAVDHNHNAEGVKLGYVFAGSLADRSGLSTGDVIIQVGDTAVKKIHDIEDYFATVNDGKPFGFEEDSEPAVDFTVKRQEKDGTWSASRTVTVRWKPVRSSRVDAKWNRRENALEVLCRHVSGFSLYFTDELVDAGQEFHLYINNVPYQDLVDPATTPDYPVVKPGSPAIVADDLYRMRKKRAKVAGWKPDFAWSLEDHLETRDRRQVYGAHRTIDLTKFNEAFEKARSRHAGRRSKKGERIKKALDSFREGGKKQ